MVHVDMLFASLVSGERFVAVGTLEPLGGFDIIYEFDESLVHGLYEVYQMRGLMLREAIQCVLKDFSLTWQNLRIVWKLFICM